VENAAPEYVSPDCRNGKCETGKYGKKTAGIEFAEQSGGKVDDVSLTGIVSSQNGGSNYNYMYILEVRINTE